LACNDSTIEPDSHSTRESEEVKVSALEKTTEEKNIDEENLFLKVEAEGFEPEVIRGLVSKRPKVIAVDIAPERNNKSPKSYISEVFENFGYETTESTEKCLFAKW